MDGLLVNTLNETDMALRAAREQGVYKDLHSIERNERAIQVCCAAIYAERKPQGIRPLYDVLRRASAIAHGAGLALSRLRSMRLEDWATTYVASAAYARIESPPTEAVLNQIIDAVVSHPPTPPPSLNWVESSETPPDYVRLLWLNELPTHA